MEPTPLQRWQDRARVLRALRQFFETEDFIEVDTAVAVRAPAPELYIEAPEVRLQSPDGPLTRYLQTSPELPMKRLLAAGLPRIFQIAAVFREGDFSPTHRPEFRLLEWYRRNAAWTTLWTDCEGLVRAAAQAAGCGNTLHYQGRRVELAAPFVRLSVDEAFRRWVGFGILDCLDAEVLRGQLRQANIFHSPTDSWDDLFHRAFVSRVEPALAQCEQPVFLTHYPAPLAALARTSQADPRASERFELYVAGLELANGFGELTDAAEQRKRFTAEAQARQRAGRRNYPLDERFLAALDALPPSAGIALGLERLLMLVFNAAHIDEVAFIAWRDT